MYNVLSKRFNVHSRIQEHLLKLKNKKRSLVNVQQKMPKLKLTFKSLFVC
ncbi:hypothetical protein JOC85_003070 [Bacillus mesophilus]|nr:hypothetical protein [Bacillus mesophilus]